MKVNHFQALSQGVRRELVKKKGALLANRHTEDFAILLYQMDAFYVELYYNLNTSEVAWVKSFESTDELEPYLENINLSNLFN